MASKTIAQSTRKERRRTLSVQTGIIFGLAAGVNNYNGGTYKTKTISIVLPFLLFEYEIKTYK